MGTRQPARLTPTPAYGLPEAVVAAERPRGASGFVPLTLLVIALAAAAVWFVALPAFAKPPAKRACEVVVLQSGSTACVRDPTHGSRAVARKGARHAER
jgi:hypothetical protein